MFTMKFVTKTCIRRTKYSWQKNPTKGELYNMADSFIQTFCQKNFQVKKPDSKPRRKNFATQPQTFSEI